MTIAIIVIASLGLLTLLYLLAIQGRKGQPGMEELRRWCYAHRGLHDENTPENSMSAFCDARDGGYGVELDVHLMADGNLAVIHDSDLKRVTGHEGKIEELTWLDLPKYPLGPKDTIPLLPEVLRLFNGKAPLIIELKPAKGNHKALAQAVCDLLESYHGPFCLESFDPRCILWLKKNRPELLRGQLTENYFVKGRPKIPVVLKLIMTHHLGSFLTKPDFIAYRYADRRCTLSNRICLKYGCGVSWTLYNREEFDQAVSEGWVPIFEGFRPDPDTMRNMLREG